MEMLQALKYIVLFLLGYKIIKELFKEKPQAERKKMPGEPERMRVNQQPDPMGNKHYTDAELIDYEEVK
jgi:hypothetical protein